MKTIGIIGGMSWESTAEYYKLINEEIREQLGGLNSAKILLHSVNFEIIRVLQQNNQWEAAGDILGKIASSLQDSGADMVILATNTMHKVANFIDCRLDVPFIHIVDPTAKALKEDSIKRVALLGTGYTIREDFYKGRLQDMHSIETMVPSEVDTLRIDDIIFNELCVGIFKEDSLMVFKSVIDKLRDAGAGAVILGCTEIGLLLKQKDSSLPIYDTTEIHAKSVANLAIEGYKKKKYDERG